MPVPNFDADEFEEQLEKAAGSGTFVQFHGTYRHVPADRSQDVLPPGFYNVHETNMGFVYEPIIDLEKDWHLIEIKGGAFGRFEEVLTTFLVNEPLYRLYKIPYRRGVLLSGPPGTGKTCLVRQIARAIAKQGGYILNIDGNCSNDIGRIAKEIRGRYKKNENPLMIFVFEEIENVHYSYLLSALDGAQQVDRSIAIATTNAPDKLHNAIINRPGRFDVHLRVGFPSLTVRREFIKGFLPQEEARAINIEDVAKATSKLPLGHIKEVILGIRLFNQSLNESVTRVKSLAAGEKFDEE